MTQGCGLVVSAVTVRATQIEGTALGGNFGYRYWRRNCGGGDLFFECSESGPVTMEGATGLTFSEVESRSEKGSSTRF